MTEILDKGESASPINSILPGRAIYAFCQEINSELFRNIASLYLNFEKFFNPNTILSSPLDQYASWAGDVHKFGVHITLRGVCPIEEEKIGTWFNILRDVAGSYEPIILKKSRLSVGFPCRVIVTFDEPAREKSRLNDFSVSLARAIKPLIRWRHISISEIEEMRLYIDSIQLIESIKKERIKILDEITTELTHRNLPPLPDRPEYRMPLLVSLWRDKKMREALFEVGDPFAVYLEPHISILSSPPSREKAGSIITQMENQFPRLIGQSIQLDRVYGMRENLNSRVPVNERDSRTGILRRVQKPRWEIEASFPIGNLGKNQE
jgi:hypothetical protein